jgi:hypothetical protein
MPLDGEFDSPFSDVFSVFEVVAGHHRLIPVLKLVLWLIPQPVLSLILQRVLILVLADSSFDALVLLPGQ